MPQFQQLHSCIPSRPAKPRRLRRCVPACVAALALSSAAHAGFGTFNGYQSAEAEWRTSVGATLLESFEDYANGTQIAQLPSLQVRFDALAGGGHPQAYAFGGTPHGLMHLGNFPAGINAINRWNDIVMRPFPGFTLHAVGFWNGDGQADTLQAHAYDVNGLLLGSVGAFKGSFGGFISSTPVAWVRFDGQTGDGWNHLDGLQVNAVPEPRSVLLLALGVLALTVWRHRQTQLVNAARRG
jgi:hypothetical protein